MAARLRGAVFVLALYLLMGTMGVIGAPVVLWRADWARAWMKAHNRIAFAMLRRLCGLRIEVRGTPPRGSALVAAKHQSLLDVLVLYTVLPEPRFVMKRELLLAPVFGLYARRAGALPIDRSGGSATIRAMIAAFGGRSGQVVIYPQGTRVPPGVRAPYRRGAIALYEALALPLVPVATNAGHFWPRRGISRHPGVAVVEFLPAMPPGAPAEAAGQALERIVETASDRLSEEARARFGR